MCSHELYIFIIVLHASVLGLWWCWCSVWVLYVNDYILGVSGIGVVKKNKRKIKSK